MPTYAKRTCHSCGIILPQPEMSRETISVRAGSGNTGLSKRNVLGAALGNQGAIKRIFKFLFNPSKRVYARNKQVWLCPSCTSFNNN